MKRHHLCGLTGMHNEPPGMHSKSQLICTEQYTAVLGCVQTQQRMYITIHVTAIQLRSCCLLAMTVICARVALVAQSCCCAGQKNRGREQHRHCGPHAHAGPNQYTVLGGQFCDVQCALDIAWQSWACNMLFIRLPFVLSVVWSAATLV